MNRKMPFVKSAFGLLLLAALILSNSNNPNNGNTGAPGEGLCTNCHGSPPAGVSGTLALSGLPATVMPNTTYSLTVTSTVTAGSPNTAGFQMVALNESNQNAGDFFEMVSDLGTETSANGREYIEHRGDKLITGGTVSWTFDWTSPSSVPGSGSITFYSTSILANNNGSSGGDRMLANTFSTNLIGGNPPVFVNVVNSSNVSCFGGNDGTATAQATGGTPPFTYNWSNGQNGPTATNLSAGFYTVTVNDGAGQTATDNVIVSQPPLLQAPIVSQMNVDCFGDANGQAIVGVTGGTPGYAYLWSNGSTSPIANNLPAGPFSVTVTDANNCTAIGSGMITQPALLVAQIVNSTNVNCNGSATGSATVAPLGGTAPYAFLWSNGATTPNVSGLSAGTYTVTIFDGNQCTATAMTVINEPTALTAVIANTVDADCNGAATGAATVQPGGGTGQYGFLWPSGGTGPTEINLPAGTYTVTVTDANSCETTATATIGQPAAIQLTASVQDVSCGGFCDGAIDLTVAGAAMPVDVNWSTGENTEDIEGLCVGSYSVTVTDANGCFVEQTFTVSGAATLTLNLDEQVDVDCNGNATGFITVSGSGGDGNYAFNWSNGETGSMISDLPAGTYGVTLTDGANCTDFLSVTMTEPAVLIANTTATAETSDGANDGTALAMPQGGTGPYTYLWSNNETNAMITNLAPGTYSVTVTDANNCVSIESVSVNPFACTLAVQIQSMHVSCNGGSDGQAIAMISGANEPVSYLWSSGGTEMMESGLSAGSYSVTVEDATNCTFIANVTINQPSALNATAGVDQQVSCFGENSGMASIEVSGGTPDYSILWPSGNMGTTEENLAAGTYLIVVLDANNCSINTEVTITEPNALLANAGATGETGFEANDGTATAIPSGGTPDYTYLWNTGSTMATITDLSPGEYAVTVTDANNCQVIEMITVEAFVCTLAADISGMNVSCNGGADGTATAVAIGGDEPYSFAWSNGESTQSICELTAATYTVTITDATNCPASIEVVIGEPDPLEGIIDEINDLSCNGANDGSARVDAQGGTTPYTFEWITASGDTLFGPIQTGLMSAVYTVIATDANNCIVEFSLAVEEPEVLTVVLQATNESGDGADDGTVTAIPDGGTSPYSYLWSTGATTSMITDLAPGLYSLTVEDANGCMTENQITILPFDCQLEVTLAPSHVSCFGFDDGAIAALVIDENDPPMLETVLWSTGATGTTVIDELAPGNYSLTVTNTNGCTVVKSIEITEPAILSSTVLNVTDVACAGEATGQASFIALGGTSPYSYITNQGVLTGDAGEELLLEGLPAGSYEVEVQDANACMITFSYTVNEPSALIGELSNLVGVDCPDDMDGQAGLVAEGGTPPYTYQWSNGDTGTQADSLAAGMYSVTVQDANSCLWETSFIVEILDAEAPTVVVQEDLVLYLDATGQAGLSAAMLDGGSFDNCAIAARSVDVSVFDCSAIGEQAVTLTVTDVVGNLASATALVSVQDTIAPILVVPADTTLFNCDGFFEYEVLASDNCEVGVPVLIEGLPSGSNFPLEQPVTVTWQVEDLSSGNSTTASFTVTVLNAMEAAIPLATKTCPDEAEGTATVLAFGGTEPYSYSWNDPDNQSGETAIGLAAGLYTVTVTDATGCMIETSVEIQAFAAITVQNVVVNDENNGSGDGSIDITVTGDGPFSFEWLKDGAVFSADEDLTGLSAGLYSVMITDANGCIFTADPIPVENISGTSQTLPDFAVRLFPNPAREQFLVEAALFDGQAPTFQLFNTQGRAVEIQSTPLDRDQFQVRLIVPVAGVYWLRIEVGGVVVWKRVVIL